MFQRVQFRRRIAVGNQSQKLSLGKFVAGRPVAADAHAEDARPATFALRLQHRVENHFAAAVEVAVRFQFFIRQRVLRADVFTAAAFEHEPHADFVRAMLVEMERGRAGADVGAVVDARQRVHRILSQVAFLRRLFDRQATGILERNLVRADRAVDIKQDAPGVLTDRLRLLFRQRDVTLDDLHRGLGDGAFLLPFQRIEDGFLHVIRDFSGRAADQFNQGILQRVHTGQP